MNSSLLLLILCSVALSAGAQLVLKTGMSAPQVLEQLRLGLSVSAVWAVASNRWVLGGLFMYFASAAVWLLVLARVEVSLAYPFVGLGFILTSVLGVWLLGETFSATRIAGAVLVALGVVLISRGAAS